MKPLQSAIIFTALLVINAPAVFAQSGAEVGTYRSQAPTVGTGEENRIVRVLRLREDGSAEIVSRYRGNVPTVNAVSLRRHGNLLTLIKDQKKIYHEGTWSSSRGKIDVNLTRTDGANIQSRLAFQLRGDSLITIAWDQYNYGSAGFKFLRIDDEGDDDDEPSPSAAGLSLSDRGSGSLQISRDPARNFERATVATGADGQAEINLVSSSGADFKLVGKIIRQDNTAADVSLTRSGQSNASGTLTVEPGSGNRIKRITGRGRIDGRDFTLSFRGESPTGDSGGGQNASEYETFNFSRRGRGIFAQDGKRNLNITEASVQSRSNGDVEVILLLSDRSRRIFTGRLNFSDAYSLMFSPANSGQSTASGNIAIDFGDDKAINSVTGEGKIDNARFSIQFSK